MGYWTLALLGTAFICGCNFDGDVEMRVYVDEGICLMSVDGGTVVGSSEVPQCLSSSCDTVVTKSCSITVEDEQIRVRSHSVVDHGGIGHCTTDCGRSYAYCEAEEVPAGTYTLRYGDAKAEVELPFAEEGKILEGVVVGDCRRKGGEDD